MEKHALCLGTDANICVSNTQDRSKSKGFSSLPSEDWNDIVIFLFSCICDIYFPLFFFFKLMAAAKEFLVSGERGGERGGNESRKVRTICLDHRCIFLVGGHI